MEKMILAQGAEAVIKLNDDQITKERVRKGYRIKELDEALRKKRNRTEASILRQARRIGVSVPRILEENTLSLKLEFIDGIKLRDWLGKDIQDMAIQDKDAQGKNVKTSKRTIERIAESIAKLHNNGIIHGDLTTSNMILRDGNVYFIDFGLAFVSQRPEDKGSDLHLLHEALESTHFSILEKTWPLILETYRKAYDGADKVIKALSEIEKRGRYREK